MSVHMCESVSVSISGVSVCVWVCVSGCERV